MHITFKKVINQFKKAPWYGWLFAILIIGIQAAYFGIGYAFGPLLMSKVYKITPWIVGIDDNIPLVPYFFAQMYCVYFVAVPLGALLASSKSKKDFINLVIAWNVVLAIGMVICAVCPTYMDRESGVPGIPDGGNLIEYIKDKGGFSYWILKTLVFKARFSWNKMPSFHCLSSIFCYLGIARRKDTHLATRISWLFISLSICVSTFMIKQHYSTDFILAVLICMIGSTLIKVSDPASKILQKHPNFLIVKKLNWKNEKIVPLDTKNKGDVKIEKVG